MKIQTAVDRSARLASDDVVAGSAAGVGRVPRAEPGQPRTEPAVAMPINAGTEPSTPYSPRGCRTSLTLLVMSITRGRGSGPGGAPVVLDLSDGALLFLLGEWLYNQFPDLGEVVLTMRDASRWAYGGGRLIPSVG